jgi:hypothetical protein
MKKERRVIVDRFIGAAVCAGISAGLMIHYPDAWDGQVLNPVIALAKYALPAAALLLLLDGAWRLGLALKGKPPRGLGSSLITRMLERWSRRNDELRERLTRQPGDANGLEDS